MHTSRIVQNRKFFAANGEQMGTNSFASFKLEIPELRNNITGVRRFINIIDALVINDNNVPDTSILIGGPELSRLKIDLLYSSGKIDFTTFSQKIPMKKKISKFNVSQINELVSHLADSESLDLESSKNNSKSDQAESTKVDIIRRSSSFSSFKSTKAVKNLKINSTNENLESNPDSRAEYKIRLERLREKRLNEYTIDDISFNDEFCSEHPELKTKCLNILQEFKDVFQNVTGKTHDKYAVQGHIEGECSSTRQRNIIRSEKIENAIVEKLDLEASDGVLVFPDEHDVVPRNFIPMMAIEKKDDEGKIISIDNGGLRLLGDCGQRLNKITTFPAMEIDSLSETLKKAASASIYKYKMKFDISNAFHQIPIAKELWKYFCVYHPKMGTMCYTRLCQGWCGSFGWTRNIFLHLFSKFDKHLFRFMDDGFLYGETEEIFLKNFKLFLSTCRYYGLKLKGKKLKLFDQKMNFLGTVIENGKILPNPHHQLKTLKLTINDIKTASEMRKYLGMCVSLARHMHRSTDVFKHLRKEAGKEGKTLIDWKSNNGFLEKEFDKSKRALKELTKLTPFDNNKPPFILVDTSIEGTGAILYQKNENGENNVVEFYSRKRMDSERKYVASSCILETAGLCGAVNFWRHFLEDSPHPTTIFTDSKSLEAVASRFASNQIPSDIRLINKFFSDLQGLRLRVKYIPGKSIQIQGVDIMSRSKNMTECDQTCDICKLASIPNNLPTAFINNVSTLCYDLKSKYQFHQDEIFLTPPENLPSNSNNLQAHSNNIQAIIINDSNKPETSEQLDQVEHVPWTYDTEAFDTNRIIAPVRLGPENRFTLEELLGCHWFIRDAQAKAKHLRQATRILKKGEKIPPRHPRVENLIHKKKSFLENGILKYKRWIGEDEFTVIPIHLSILNTAISAIHKAYGCKSPTQMCHIFNRHFECENSKTHIDLYLKKCQKCVLLRKNNNSKALPAKKNTHTRKNW